MTLNLNFPRLMLINSYFSNCQKVTLAQEKMQADYDKLKSDESDKSAKLAELSLQVISTINNRQLLRNLLKSGFELELLIFFCPYCFETLRKDDNYTEMIKYIMYLRQNFYMFFL